MARHDLLDLFEAYLEQRLSESDRLRLRAELLASPQARRIFWHYVHQHAMLGDLLAEARGRQLAQEEEPILTGLVVLASPADPLPPRLWVSNPRFWAGALAAGLLFAVSLTWLFRPAESTDAPHAAPLLARLAELRGDVQIVGSSSQIRARTGQLLRPGEEIHTGEGSSAVVAYADSSRLELHAQTAMRLLEQEDVWAPSKRVFLVHGVVQATVAPQPAGRPMVLRTPQADLLSPAGRFSSASVLDETRVELEHGKAIMTRDGTKSIEIHTGTYAIAAADPDAFASAPMVPARGSPRAILEDRSGPVLGFAVRPDGQTIAMAGWDGVIRLWDARSQRLEGVLEAGQKRVLALNYSPDGQFLVAGYESPKRIGVIVWDVSRQRPQQVLPQLRGMHALAFTPDSQSLLLASSDRGFRSTLVWDRGDVRERLALGSQADRVLSLTVSPDGQTAAVGCRDGKIRLWNLNTGRLEYVLEGHQRDVQSLAYQPGGAVLASGSLDGTIRLWSAATGEQLRTFTGPFTEVRWLAFSPDGQTLATGHAGVANLWDVRSGEKRGTLKAHKFAVTGISYLPDGQTLVTSGWDRSIKLWDLQPAERH